MSIYDIDSWSHSWLPRKGRHVWTKPGHQDIWVRENGAWSPGMPYVGVYDGLLPRQATVERTYRRKTLPHALVGEPGKNLDGGPQGAEVYLDLSRAPRSQTWLDGVVERHSVSATDWATGEPLTRDVIGHDYGYQPLRETARSEPPFQLPFYKPVADHPCSAWQRYDPAHLHLAYVAAVAMLPDPVALFQLVRVANDVLLAEPNGLPVRDGGQSLYQQLRNARGTFHGSAYSGEVRARAWELGAVTQAYKAVAPEYRAPFASWMRDQIEFVWQIQAPSGALTRGSHASDAFQSHPWIVTADGQPPLSDDAECETWWESCFLTQTLFDAAEALGERVSMGRVTQIVRKRRAILDTAGDQFSGQYGSVGPKKFHVVARNDVLVDTIEDGAKPGLNSYNSSFLKVCRELGL